MDYTYILMNNLDVLFSFSSVVSNIRIIHHDFIPLSKFIPTYLKNLSVNKTSGSLRLSQKSEMYCTNVLMVGDFRLLDFLVKTREHMLYVSRANLVIRVASLNIISELVLSYNCLNEVINLFFF